MKPLRPALSAPAAERLPTSAEPDPTQWRRGFPPPGDRLIRIEDGALFRYPQLRWSFSHARELGPTKAVWRGDGAVAPLNSAGQGIGGLSFAGPDGAPLTLAQSLAQTHADGFVVLHRGRIVHESYAGEGAAHRPHIWMSLTKSLIGTIAATLIHDGALDEGAIVSHYVPELARGAYGDATLRQVLDMLIGVDYCEDYAEPDAQIWDYARAAGWLPRPPSYDGPQNLHAYLPGLRKKGEHGKAFDYKTVNTEVLGWVVKRATGQSLAELVSSSIWAPMGAEADGYFLIDSTGAELAGCGLASTLRDLARFGEMMRCEGEFNGRQIVPAAVVADIRRGADRGHFKAAGYSTLPGFSYRNMWWATHDARGTFLARGIHGQSLYIDPVAEVTIARFASFPLAANRHNDPLTFPAYRRIVDVLGS
ncbi:serine hydrolase [uncultured Rhodoblastus sp.]|uniref:serine hydrolase domain-containing protein n=1 Tax=uncultured Rhodoblastus sp. TaxID=543037 RepID=UPI0025D6B324|nr:serine hydrolase [uncultured Rhodoblastus sp.]